MLVKVTSVMTVVIIVMVVIMVMVVTSAVLQVLSLNVSLGAVSAIGEESKGKQLKELQVPKAVGVVVDVDVCNHASSGCSQELQFRAGKSQRRWKAHTCTA